MVFMQNKKEYNAKEGDDLTYYKEMETFLNEAERQYKKGF
jgi:hypothetical protein